MFQFESVRQVISKRKNGTKEVLALISARARAKDNEDVAQLGHCFLHTCNNEIVQEEMFDGLIQGQWKRGRSAEVSGTCVGCQMMFFEELHQDVSREKRKASSTACLPLGYFSVVSSDVSE